MRRALDRCGLAPDEIDSAMGPWDGSSMAYPKPLEEWARSWAYGQSKKTSVLLCGMPGRGKTKIAAMCARAYIEAGGTGLLWVVAPEVTRVVMEQRSSRDSSSSQLENEILKAKFLVIDELGAERSGTRSDAVSDWILWRYRRKMPLLSTTNGSDESAVGDARVASRLGQGIVYSISDAVPDYRPAL